MKVVLAHPGTQHAFRLARELNRVGFLTRFVTSLALPRNNLLARYKGLSRRRAVGIESTKLKSYPSLLLLEKALHLVGYRAEEVYHIRNKLFQQWVIQNDIDDADIVIGFDTSSWLLAKYCALRGKKFVLDVSIGHSVSKEKVFSVLRKKYPAWHDVSIPKRAEIVELEEQEFQYATRIVVPSRFVRDTLVINGVNDAKISINPFGTDLVEGQNSEVARPVLAMGDVVTFLFFGTLSARKGLPLLLEAWKRLTPKRSRLLLAGFGFMPETVILPSNVELIGPVQFNERGDLFKRADVFVFPSHFEGFAQVLVEAAACGLPIISTVNAGAAELIIEGENGFLVETDTVDSLVDKMIFFQNNPGNIYDMGKNSMIKAGTLSWKIYSDRWVTMINSMG